MSIVMENSKSNQHSATLDEVKGDVRELKGMIEDVLFSVNEFADETRREFVKAWQVLSGTASKQDLAEMATKQDLAEMASKQDLEDWGSKMATRFVTKSYLDDKLADQTSEIFLRLDRRQDKDRNFKEKGLASSAAIL